jgi:hypothetical protein
MTAFLYLGIGYFYLHQKEAYASKKGRFNILPVHFFCD